MNTTIRKFVKGEREKQLNRLASAITVEDYADFNLKQIINDALILTDR